MSNKRRLIAVIAAVAMFIGPQYSLAVDGSWQLGGITNNWGDTSNWISGTAADGVDYTANFLVDIPTGGLTVNVDTLGGQTIGNLYFGYDTDTSTAGGWLIQGNAINLSRSTVGNASDIYSDPLATDQLVEISAPISVAAGANLTKSGGGAMKLSGATTVNDGNATIGDASTVTLTGTVSVLNPTATNGYTGIEGGSTVSMTGLTAQLSSANMLNVGSGGGGNGTLDMGVASTDHAIVTANAGFNLGGGDGAVTGTLNVRGTSVLNAGSGATVSTVGNWGTSSGALNLYDSAIVNTGELRAGQWNTSSGTITLNNGSELHSATMGIGYNADPAIAGTGGTLTSNNSSIVTTTGNADVGASSNGTLTINDSSTVGIGGILYVAHNGFWGTIPTGITGTINIGGVSDSNPLGTPTLNAGSINTSGNWINSPSTNYGNISFINVSGNAHLNTIKAGLNTGDFLVCSEWGSSTVTISDDAQVSVGGQLGIGLKNNTTATVNISGTTSKLTAGEIAMATDKWGGSAKLNISGDAQVVTTTTGGSTGNLIIGQPTNTGWFAWNDAIAITGNGLLDLAGSANISQASINVNGNGKFSTVGSFVVGQAGVNWSNINLNGTNSSSIGGDLTVNRAELKTSAINNLVVPGGVKLTGTLYLNGGQITPTASSTTFLGGLAGAKIGQYGGTFMTWSGSANTNITIAQALAHDSAGPATDGGIVAIGNGSVTLDGALTYTGQTRVDGLTLLQIDSPGTTTLASIIGTNTDGGRLGIGDDTHIASVSATSVNVGIVTIGAGSTLKISPIPGGPLSGGGLTAVPEPSTFAMLAIAAFGLMAAAWRRRK